MKKRMVCLLSLLLCVCLLSGCGLVILNEAVEMQTDKPEITEPTNKPVTPPPSAKDDNTLPGDFPMDFYFSSGAGAWGTELVLKKDGSFTGEYHDSNMGETGDGHPNGTVYLCSFEGAFGDVKKINDYSYKMTLQYVDTQKPAGTQWIEDGVLYVTSDPYGLEMGKEFIFYTPDAKTDSLSEEFLSWWPYRFEEDDGRDRLSCYGIYNLDGEYGFFGE